MSTFTAQSLVEGDLIIAVVESLNAIDYSLPSDENTSGALVQIIPADPVAAPIRNEDLTSETQIVVDLETVTINGGATITSYGLEMDDGNGYVGVSGVDFDSLSQQVKVTATDNNIQSGQSYDFRYRVKNVHGWSSQYSPVATIIAATVPSEPLNVVTSNTLSTTVTVSWDEPNSLGGTGLTITAYQVLV